MEALLDFFGGKRVLITGHTGFKGSWLSLMLAQAGADVIGYSLAAPTSPHLYGLARVEDDITSYLGDVCRLEQLEAMFEMEPEIVFHLAAQPIVRDSYDDPHATFEINTQGTLNVLECARQTSSVRSLVNVTTDKVYFNEELPDYAYAEDDKLEGYDPYSNSKSCSDLMTRSYARCFLDAAGCATSTARAGNVIGGGDFANDRVIADCVRAAAEGHEVLVRNPNSVRPFQHVLEPLSAYLLIAKSQYEDASKAGSYNVGPDECDCVTTGELVDLWCSRWEGATSRCVDGEAPDSEDAAEQTELDKHEAGFLKLDNSKIKRDLGWRPRWHIDEAVARTAEWTRAWLDGDDVAACMCAQIADYYAS